MSSPPTSVQWTQLDQTTFNRFVEALLIRLHTVDTPSSDVQAIDGRGGDKGRDVDLIRRGVYEHIYQLKYFPQGFSSEFARSRKPQIQRSFSAAMVHNPKEWTLVIPTNPTPGERDFVKSLKKSYASRIKILGQAQLDGLMARFPDLLAWATREPLLDVLRSVQMEKAALVAPGDLKERVEGLQAIADSRNPNWTVDHQIVNGQYVESLRAKHPRANEVEPISFKFTSTFKKEDSETLEQFRRVVGYGDNSTVRLPEDVVKIDELNVPEWFKPPGIDGPVALDLTGQSNLPKAVEVEFQILDDNDFVIHTYSGPATHLGHGPEGNTLKATISGHVDVELFIDGDPLSGAMTTARMNMSHQIIGLPANEAHAGLEFRRDILREGKARLLLDASKIAEFATGPKIFKQALDDGIFDTDTPALIDDLALLERELHVVLNVPSEITGQERLMIRSARLLLEGHVIIHPFQSDITGTMNDEIDPSFVRNLQHWGGPHFSDTDAMAMDLFGKHLNLGPARVAFAHARIENRDELVEALKRGDFAGMPIRIIPIGTEGLRILLLDRVNFPDGAEIEITAWGLAGVEEHPELRGITEPPAADASGAH